MTISVYYHNGLWNYRIESWQDTIETGVLAMFFPATAEALEGAIHRLAGERQIDIVGMQLSEQLTHAIAWTEGEII